MKTLAGKLLGWLFLAAVFSLHAPASVLYVDVNSTSPVSPYADWSTAATDIQSAIDAATDGDLILVTNGVYQTGGRVVFGSLTNRVVINKAVTVQSVNGPAATIIQGNPFIGDSAVRCVYLTNSAALIGFTLRNGATRDTSGDLVHEQTGGGAYCESFSATLSNCILTANSAKDSGGGSYQGTLNSCMLSSNSVVNNSGGGANSSALNNCVLTGNSAFYGGGAYNGTLNNCSVSNNSGLIGGGAYSATLTNCIISGNSASSSGGGVYQGAAFNCTLTGNSAHGSFGTGGGSTGAKLSNCALSGNSANYQGGGANGGALLNCTIAYNTARVSGGGLYVCSATNCIIYYNTAGLNNNYAKGSPPMNYCCTTPLPTGLGSISNEPILVSFSHLSTNSPCRGVGSAATLSGVDIDGEPWANPPSMGCDEAYPGNVNGLFSVGILANYTNIAPGYAGSFQANIAGPVYASKWDFGDGTVITNQPYITHIWSMLGDYPVTLTAYNDTYPSGQSATNIIHVVIPTVLYVASSNQAPVAPYDSWAKAATNIQNAVDVAYPGNLILVSNGVYKIGSRTSIDGGTNRVVAMNSLTVQSVNGAVVTTIDGGNIMRCVYLTNGATLVGFTLTSGNTGAIKSASTNERVSDCILINNSGVGAYSGTISNCTLAMNAGGGAYSSILKNCILTNNTGIGASACNLNNCLVISNSGNGITVSIANSCKIIGNKGNEASGGAYQSTLFNCTIIGQYHTYGAYGCNLRNCIIYYNDGAFSGTTSMINCCTPLLNSSFGSPPSGYGNFTNAPLFINWTAGDYHLQSNSPCINAGNNAYVVTNLDFDGNPRIVGGTVDMGVYEFQNPGSILSYAWAQKYGLPTDGGADYLDSDGDGLNNWQEWIAGTVPTNAASVLQLSSPSNSVSGVTVTWQSVTNVIYYLQRSSDLAGMFSSLQSNLVGQVAYTSYTDLTATNGGPYFYRVGVQ